MKRPIRLAIVDEYVVVIDGVASLMAEERIDVVETDASMPVSTDVDIVLYDTFGQIQGDGLTLEDYVRDSDARVVLYSWNLQPDLIERALASGVRGYLSKVLTGSAIVDALERIMSGEVVIATGENETSVGATGDWPGRDAGLSPREAEVVALITNGLTDQEIADRAFLSLDVVQSRIGSAFATMGVDERSQAVLWGVRNGFIPNIQRKVDVSLRDRPVTPAH